MRIKKFIAENMNILMQQVKKELGEEAVIISTSEIGDNKIEMIAAIESDDILFDDGQEFEIISAKFNDSFIRKSLSYHEASTDVQSRLLALSREMAAKHDLSDDSQVLEQVFSELFNYYDILTSSRPVKMFFGTQGGGKSTAIAKIATMAKLKNISTAIISTDNVRAGCNNQLKAFSDILQSEFVVVKEAEQLSDKILSLKADYQLILIDTPGINPFIAKDVDRLSKISREIICDKILVFDAGYNSYDAIEAAEVFIKLGANCMLPTKLDLTRRIGAILSVAVACDLALGYAGVGSGIANGLAKVTNRALSNLILAGG